MRQGGQKCFRHKFRYKGAKKYHLAAVSSTAAWWFNSLVRSSKGLKPQWLLAPRYSSNKI